MRARRLAEVRRGAALALAIALGPALVHAASPAALPGAEEPAAASATAGETSGRVAARVSISAVAIDLRLAQETARAGQRVKVYADLTNLGSTNLTEVLVVMQANPPGVTVRPAESRTIRRLAPALTETMIWTVCGRAGTYTLVATATVDGVPVNSAPAELSINGGKSC